MKRFKWGSVVSLLLVVALGLFCLIPASAAADREAAGSLEVKEYPVPTANSEPIDIVAGPDGALWFTEILAHKIGRITTSGQITEYPLPTFTQRGPNRICVGPDGAIWFTGSNNNKIGRITTSGVITEYSAGMTAHATPTDITAGPDGALWFAEQTADKIGRITTAGVITNEFPLPAHGGYTSPAGIAAGPDGALWFTTYGSTRVGRITTAGVVTEFETPSQTITGGIQAGPDGAMWFTESTVDVHSKDKIGRVTMSGEMSEFPTPADSQPVGIAFAPDGALWFTERSGTKIGRMTLDGAVTEFNVPTEGSTPTHIALGPNGNMWFTEMDGNKIGTFVPQRADTEVITPDSYLCEGSTAWGFDCYIRIMNPNNQTVNLTMTYNTDRGAIPGPSGPLEPMSVAWTNPRDTIGDADFSAEIHCTERLPISADRTMMWGTPGVNREAHCSVGVGRASKVWYLAEGSTEWGFECWLALQNPNETEASVKVTYMIENEGPRSMDVKVPAKNRKTYNMADTIGKKDASIKVESDIPVTAERAMYRNNRREGHASIGTVAPANDFYLAEGAVGWGSRFTTYVLVQNPNGSATDVDIKYQTQDGLVQGPQFTMIPNSRKTVRLNDQLSGNANVSTHVRGSQPIVAERAMYWNTATGEVCHDSIGMAAPHSNFYLADGWTDNGGETWTLVQNPNDTDVEVRISYLRYYGKDNVVKNEVIPANSRKTFDMRSHSGIDGDAGIMVECLTPGKKVMVERSMYWDNRGVGTDTIGSASD